MWSVKIRSEQALKPVVTVALTGGGSLKSHSQCCYRRRESQKTVTREESSGSLFGVEVFVVCMLLSHPDFLVGGGGEGLPGEPLFSPYCNRETSLILFFCKRKATVFSIF